MSGHGQAPETTEEPMRQEAPWPQGLADLVDKCELEPGWRIVLVEEDRGQGSKGLTLEIVILGFNTYKPEEGRTYRVRHLFPVPPASFNRRSWQRWLFDRYVDVLRHEAGEWFKVDGKRPYAPHHGPGEDPYVTWEVGEPGKTKERAR